MGFMNAGCSFTRFRITEAIPDTLWGEITQRLKQFAFRDIDEMAEERAWGWVCFDDMLDTDWHAALPEKGAYIAFSLRLDTRRIPAAVLKKHLTLALREEKARLKEQGKNFISRDRRMELKEQTKLRLMSRFLPIPAEFQVVWNTTNQNVWFASTQSKVLDLFTEYFTQTFDLPLDQQTPAGLACTFLDEQQQAALDRLEPTKFAAE